MIYFDTNGGLEDFQPISTTHYQKLILQEPTREGYRFIYWVGLDRRIYEAGEIIRFYELNDVYLTAFWSELYTLSFVTGFLGTQDEVELVSGEILVLEPMEREGYLFGGYYQDEEFLIPAPSRMPNSDLILYVKWTEII
jgi:hypothetical protein